MEKFVYLCLLFDIYKELLTDKEKKIFSLYYEENLTLQEIADNYDVSKSYIGNVIKRCEKKLEDYESLLNIYKTKEKINSLMDYQDIKKIKEELNSLL